ncbi:MAG: carbohydrate ABC transporter permease [Lachnospiraceae bacterium]|nr:carbohydrate ABC transporter permease [Lachnospiraceae bacterium]
MKSAKKKALLGKIGVYVVLIIISLFMIIPFLWMLSASIKTDKEVFQVPFVWIPANPQWSNYLKIWTKMPFLKYIGNTAFLTVVVTLLQLFTSSFAAYSFAKLDFKHKNVLFMAYIATIAMPWQVYMVPQFIMMSNVFHLNGKLTAMVCLQAFSAFGVFMMRQFYMGIPDELCEAARIDGMSEYKIYANIMLPLSKPALSTLTIFTFVATWNDYLGPLIYLTPNKASWTIQLGIKNTFIGQYSSEYGLLMAASVVSLIPVLIVFLMLQKYFVEGVANTGIKG